jgi:hypothetical protein
MLGTSAALHWRVTTSIPRSRKISSIDLATTVEVATAVPQATKIVFRIGMKTSWLHSLWVRLIVDPT